MTSTDEKPPLTEEQKERIKKAIVPFLLLLTAVKKYELAIMEISASVAKGDPLMAEAVYDELYDANLDFTDEHAKAIKKVDDLLFVVCGDAMAGKKRDSFRVRQNLRRRNHPLT